MQVTLAFDLLMLLSLKRNAVFYIAQLILETCLYNISLLKYPKISVTISSYFYASDISKANINVNNIRIFFKYCKEEIKAIKYMIKLNFNKMLEDPKYEYIFRKYEDSMYLNISSKYFPGE